MRLLVLFLTLFGAPAYASLTCMQVREIAMVVMTDPYLSKESKRSVLRNLVGSHGMSCINPSEWDAND